MPVCVDASFVLKLILDEDGSDTVHKLWRSWVTSDTAIIAPCHLSFEVTSVIRNRVYRRDISPAAGHAALQAFLAQEIELWHPGELRTRAWELAEHYNRSTTYDAEYLALAESIGCELWTTDRRLLQAVAGELPWVRTI